MREDKNLEEQKYIRAKKKVKEIKGFYVHFAIYIGVNLLILISRALSGEGWEVVYNWSSYGTLTFWGIGIAIHAFNVFGFDLLFGKQWEEKKIKEIMDRDKKNYWE